jgi:hypothetical protein
MPPVGFEPTISADMPPQTSPFFPITNCLHLLTPSTWRSLSTSSLHHFLGLPLRLVPTSSWAKIFLGILSSSILSRWPSQLILCPFIHFTIFSPLFNSSSSRFVILFHSPSSNLGPYIVLNIFLSKNKQSLFFLLHRFRPRGQWDQQNLRYCCIYLRCKETLPNVKF